MLLEVASRNQLRRERFATFRHDPDIHGSLGVIPTRAGFLGSMRAAA